MKQRVVSFDAFAYRCKYFDANTDVNNSYGCKQPACEDIDETENIGHCAVGNCPLCSRLSEDDLQNPELDLDGLDKGDYTDTNGEFLQDNEYAIVNAEPDTPDDVKEVTAAYNAYMRRYQKQ